MYIVGITIIKFNKITGGLVVFGCWYACKLLPNPPAFGPPLLAGNL